MPTHRILPPATVQRQTMTVNGRTYTATPGQSLDVPDFDGAVLTGSGWTFVAESGATTDRPKAPPAGRQYWDTDLGAFLTFDGASWRDPSGSAR